MLPENRRDISKLRLERAEGCLASAKTLLAVEDYRGAANRSYYAAFHAMRAVLALDGFDSKRHSGIISEFRRLYIKTEIFDSALSDIIRNLFDLRTDSDYDDFFIASKEEVTEQVQNAEYFVQQVKQYLESKLL